MKMAYFTDEQRKYLESIGAERIRDNAYWIRNIRFCGHIEIEQCGDSFGCLVEVTRGLNAYVEGNDLKRTVRSALRRFKYFAKDIQKMIDTIDELYPKTDGIPR